MNTISLTGQISKKPQITRLEDGKSFCFFNISSENLNIRCIAEGDLAESIHRRSKKGSKISIIGCLKNRRYLSGSSWRTVHELKVGEYCLHIL